MIKISWVVLFSLFICSCEQATKSDVSELRIDSSFHVIRQTAPFFADSCIPECWPRVFANTSKTAQYKLFILVSTTAADRRTFVNESFRRKVIDSLSYPLMAHLEQIPAQTLALINTSDKIGHGNRLRFQLIKAQLDRPLKSDTDLGYLQISPVVVDTRRGVGVYLIYQIGTGHFKWLVQIQLIDGHWQFVRKDLLSVS